VSKNPPKNWLGAVDVPAVADELAPPPNWLEVPETARIEASGGKMRGEKGRFGSMAKKLVGKSRVWASDGDYVAFRRKQANPASLERHNKFIATGQYKHVATHDGVEIYELQAASPFKRTQMNLGAMGIAHIRRQAVLAACARDWSLFIDVLSELAGKIKGAVATDGKAVGEGEFARNVYDENLAYIFKFTWMRGGPLQAEIDAGVQSARAARGENVGRIITTGSPVVRAGPMRPGAQRLLRRNSTVH
jgi:hypothetical protein